MGWYSILCFFFLFLDFQVHSSLSFSSNSSKPTASCPHVQSLALLQFKNSIKAECGSFDLFDAYTKTDSWKKDVSCCLWDGVICDNKTGQVVELDLSLSCLHGSISSNSPLFLLHHLRRLNLAYNSLNSSSLLPEVTKFTRLTHLNLSHLGVSGQVPSELSHLSELVSFDLSGNDQLSFHRWNFENLLRNLTRLRFLRLDFVDTSSSLTTSLSLPIGNLKSLKVLSLSNCNLKGSIPSSLSNLTQLTFLDLSNNRLEGQIPDAFENLTKLLYLSFSGNTLAGHVPFSVFNLTQLEFLDFSRNQLVGALPDKASGLSLVSELNLYENSLSGTVPSWLFTLPSLTTLMVNNNIFTGVDEFVVQPNDSSLLQVIDFSHNELEGSIPDSIFELVNLTVLDLSFNNLSGVLELDKLSKLHQLKELHLSSNILLSSINGSKANSRLPNLFLLDISNCSINEFPDSLRLISENLGRLDLSRNKLRGRFPKYDQSEGWQSLTYLNLSLNFLTSIEHHLWKNVKFLDLSSNLLEGPLLVPPLSTHLFFVKNNSLTGQISSSICNLTALAYLDLSNNFLNGTMPDCLGSLGNLMVLDLHRNHFHGSIPDFGEPCSLRTVNVNTNRFEGVLPQSLANCSELEVLSLGDNKINDTFPHWLGTLPLLEILSLRCNRFHGPIGNVETKSAFPKLRIVDLSFNDFSGFLPTKFFGCLRGMMELDYNFDKGIQYMGSASYEDSMVFTIKGMNVQLLKILKTLTVLDMSCNRFDGEIPNIVGNFTSLRVLNFSFNKITGRIPSSMGKMTVLESLDLSSNRIADQIPTQLTEMKFLAVLNLSDNRLVGQIPQGNQFNTFANDSYSGNLGLCGFPLSKRCGNDEAQQPPGSMSEETEDSAFRFDWKFAMAGYGCGLVCGFSVGYFLLTIGKPWWLVKAVELKRQALMRALKRK